MPTARRSHPAPLIYALTILTIAITLLLTPLTAFIWNHAPELAFLQFPWRLLAILAAVLALAIALALTPLNLKPTSTTILAIVIAAALTYPAYRLFHQTCDEEDTVEARLALFHSNQGTDPTDEYTPTNADNDSLAHTNPPYWLSPDPNAKAPTNTTTRPRPHSLHLQRPQPEDLILNLRDYPAWHIALNGYPITEPTSNATTASSPSHPRWPFHHRHHLHPNPRPDPRRHNLPHHPSYFSSSSFAATTEDSTDAHSDLSSPGFLLPIPTPLPTPCPPFIINTR